MNYYEVWVRSERYRGKHGLTYESPLDLTNGTIVRVSLQRQSVSAVIVSRTGRPKVSHLKPIEAVVDAPTLPPQLMSLGVWLLEYYRSSVGSVAQTLIPAAIPQTIPLPAKSESSSTVSLPAPALTDDQQRVLQQFTSTTSFLLHGRTGSGKTRIYIKLAQRQIRAGRSVIILSPEIGLTTQLAASLSSIRADIIVLHSGLTNSQRFKLWLQVALATKPLVVVGARSALFAPLKNIGLIVVDEFHEPAYKQEQEPRYHASRVAATLARLHKASLVYGSATPPVSEYYLAQTKQATIGRLTTLAKPNNVVTNTIIVDLRDRSNFVRSPYLSEPLINEIQLAMQRGEQSMLYLNRRGTARVSLCQHCGWQALCSHCDLPLTFHADDYLLRCHICNRNSAVPSSCPVCSHTEVIFKSIGTKALVSEVAKLFTDAKIARFDSDNKQPDSLQSQYASVLAGNVDIIVGTQTIAKGLDLPKLTTLGVILADSSLQLPDFTASERTYQLLQQIVGRIGRGHSGNATAVIQTYNADSELLADSLADNWPAFYERELAERKVYKFPPFYQLLVVSCRRATAASAEKACLAVANLLRQDQPKLIIDGPAPALHEKSSSGYTWQLTIKAPRRSSLLAAVDKLPSSVTSYDLDPISLL